VARLVVHGLVVGVALVLALALLPAFGVRAVAALLVGGAVVGLANAAVGALLQRADLGLTPVTFGLLLLAINVVAFGVAAGLLVGFPVGALWQIGLGGLLVTVVSWPLGLTRFVARPDPV
jgi:uncharacterized membrane protein YvlD (DUF360 family)